MFGDGIISDDNISSGNKNLIYNEYLYMHNDSFVFGNKTIFLIVPQAYK